MKKTISIILTIHNKAFLIEPVVAGILKNISPDTKELITIFDGCTDDSEMLFDKTIRDFSPGIIVIKKSAPDIWEVKSNNIGLKTSQCDFSCLIQDDMVVTEKNFDQRLRKPMQAFSDCFAVSARGSHNDVLDSRGNLRLTNLIGRENPCGDLPLMRRIKSLFGRSNDGRNIFGIRDIVFRGPLLLDNERLQKLNYLDESFSPLDLDDHDLCFRAYKEFGWICGSYTVKYDSEAHWGGVRASDRAQRVWQASRKKNELILIERHHDLITGAKHTENRILP